MHVYRISLTKFAEDITGTGAFLYGGRWNKSGTRCLYTSDSRPLAVLEYMVNAGQSGLGGQFSIAMFNIPDDNILKLNIKDLPRTWNSETLTGNPVFIFPLYTFCPRL
jgi:RES domain-containing protein